MVVNIKINPDYFSFQSLSAIPENLLKQMNVMKVAQVVFEVFTDLLSRFFKISEQIFTVLNVSLTCVVHVEIILLI